MLKSFVASVVTSVMAIGASAQISNTPGVGEALKSLGYELSPKMIGGTFKIYGPLLAKATLADVKVSTNQSYGPDERNKLDVYSPLNATGKKPILVFVHGGGFVRGDKKDEAHIGGYFAKHGVVAVIVNYRFAPNNKWPSGAQDIALVLEWIKKNAAQFGGDANQIILSGNSAGAMHVADYTFHEKLQVKDDGVLGSIIISPPTTDLAKREIDPKRDGLYYNLGGDLRDQSVVHAVTGRKIPLLIAYAENEPKVISEQTHLLIQAIKNRDGSEPETFKAEGHNHISIVAHIGTADETMGRAMLKSIAAWTKK
jgi:acetyl esterase/lipase